MNRIFKIMLITFCFCIVVFIGITNYLDSIKICYPEWKLNTDNPNFPYYYCDIPYEYLNDDTVKFVYFSVNCCTGVIWKR